MAGREPILIVGGGLGGLTTALALPRYGVAARVLDGAPQFGAIGYGIQLAQMSFTGDPLQRIRSELQSAAPTERIADIALKWVSITRDSPSCPRKLSDRAKGHANGWKAEARSRSP